MDLVQSHDVLGALRRDLAVEIDLFPVFLIGELALLKYFIHDSAVFYLLVIIYSMCSHLNMTQPSCQMKIQPWAYEIYDE